MHYNLIECQIALLQLQFHLKKGFNHLMTLTANNEYWGKIIMFKRKIFIYV